MLILALDTTTAQGSVALARDGSVLDELVGDPTVTHGQRLPGDVVSLLERHGLTTSLIDQYVVAAGPGSFTGLRVGIATVQGLALANRRRVLGVSVLDAVTEVASRATIEGTIAPEVIVPWMDAKRGEVFSALYEPVAPDETDKEGSERGLEWKATEGPVARTPTTLLNAWGSTLRNRTVTVMGDGIDRDRRLLEAAFGPRARLIADVPPLAGVMAAMASQRPWRDHAVPPHAIRPVYVRRPDAELARAQRGAHAK